MQISKGFTIAVIVIVLIGLGVFGWIYLQQKEQAVPTSTTLQTSTQPATTEKQLQDTEASFKEIDSLESEFSTSDLETLEADLDASQLNVL